MAAAYAPHHGALPLSGGGVNTTMQKLAMAAAFYSCKSRTDCLQSVTCKVVSNGTRHPWHDYRQPWLYMVTMTTFGRRPLRRICKDGKITPSEDGRLMYEYWRGISKQFPQIDTTSFVIMPDHIHGIVHVKERMEKPLGVPLRAFKSQITGALRKKHGDPALQVWNPGYHDWRILRKGSLKAFTYYIRDNPLRLSIKKKSHPDLFTRIDNLAHCAFQAA